MINIPMTGTSARTDFSSWDRSTLEQFARQAADENQQLRADLRAALDAYHRAVVAHLDHNKATGASA